VETLNKIIDNYTKKLFIFGKWEGGYLSGAHKQEDKAKIKWLKYIFDWIYEINLWLGLDSICFLGIAMIDAIRCWYCIMVFQEGMDDTIITMLISLCWTNCLISAPEILSSLSVLDFSMTHISV